MSIIILWALACLQDSPPAAEDVPVVHAWCGESSNLETPEFLRITDSRAWAEVWERHAGKGRRAPFVDFDRHMVVAAFLGKVGWEKIDVHAVKKTWDEIVFGVEVEDADCCDFSAHALYCLAVIPRSPLRLAMLSRVRSGTHIDPRQDAVLREFGPLE
ncbi:MAG: hypothetical protein HY716_00335 [Planctomycetes bacterium]|nr:hypothetical protein [Planctomycetota bacterium]